MRKTYKEITRDHGCPMKVYVSDNYAEYIITSAKAKDLYNDYVKRWGRHPTRQWFSRHYIDFVEIKYIRPVYRIR